MELRYLTLLRDVLHNKYELEKSKLAKNKIHLTVSGLTCYAIYVELADIRGLHSTAIDWNILRFLL